MGIVDGRAVAPAVGMVLGDLLRVLVGEHDGRALSGERDDSPRALSADLKWEISWESRKESSLVL